MFSLREARANQFIISPVPPPSSSPSGYSAYSRSLSPTSSAQQDVSLESNVSAPFSMGPGSPGKFLSLRGRNMKEYDEQLNSLKHENFTLKLRIHFLEDRFLEKSSNFKEDKDVYKSIMALTDETEALKKELMDKQELLQKASVYLQSLEDQYKEQIQKIEEENAKEKEDLYNRISILEKQRCQPEIEVRVNEMMEEKDRLIEDKMEQLEQQNKILVEIQITLEEQQKHNAELEASLIEVRKIVEEKSKQLVHSSSTIHDLADKLMNVEKENAKNTKELARKDKKIRDLTTELTQTLNLVSQSQLENQLNTRGGVKQMEEDEHEGLWAEIERKKLEICDLNRKLSEASSEISILRNRANKAESLIEESKQQNRSQSSSVQEITSYTNTKTDSLHSEQNQKVLLLEENLERAKKDLEEKRIEIKDLKGELKKQSELMHNIFAQELMGKNIEKKKFHKKFMKEQPNIDLQDLLNSLNLNSENRIALKQNRDEGSSKDNEAHSKDSSDKSDKGFSALENALFAHMGQKVYNTTQTFNTYVTPSNNDDEEQEDEDCPQEKSETSEVAKLLINEVASIKRETEALLQEKGKSSDQLSKAKFDNVHALKQQLHESLEERRMKDQKHQKMVFYFEETIKELKDEMKNSKKHITTQVVDMASKKYRESMEKYKQEICSLRKRLADSHNACDLLRTRLEELVDFIEQILEMDKNGIINLSSLSHNRRASLRQTLNDSRALSHSLSQSLMIGMESQLGDTLADESRFNIMLDANNFNFNMPNESNDQLDNTLDVSTADNANKNYIYENIEAKLESYLDSKLQSMDTLSENFSEMMRLVRSKEECIRDRDDTIDRLSAEVEMLCDVIKSANISKMNNINLNPELPCLSPNVSKDSVDDSVESESSKTSRGSSPIKFGKTDQEKQIEQNEIYIKSLQKDKSEQEELISYQQMEIDELNQNVSELKVGMESSSTKVINDLKQNLNKAESRILNINKEKMALVAEVSQLKTQLNTKSVQVACLKKSQRESSCTSQLTDKSQENILEISISSEHSPKSHDKLLDNLQSSQNSLQVLEKQNQQLSFDKESLTKRIDDLQEEIISLREKYNDEVLNSSNNLIRKSQYEGMLSEYAELQVKYEKLQVEKNSIQKNFEDISADAVRCLERLKQQDKLYKEATKQLAIEHSITGELRNEISQLKSRSLTPSEDKRRSFSVWYEIYKGTRDTSNPSSPSSKRNLNAFNEMEEFGAEEENKENICTFSPRRDFAHSPRGSKSNLSSSRSCIPVYQQSNIHSARLCSDPDHRQLCSLNEELRASKQELWFKLSTTENVLKDTQNELNEFKLRKESVERAMNKQLEKTNRVLAKVQKNAATKTN